MHGLVDERGRDATLHYLRTKDGTEVDLCLVERGELKQMLEAKLSSSMIDSSLRYFHKRQAVPAIQLVKNLRLERFHDGIELRRAWTKGGAAHRKRMLRCNKESQELRRVGLDVGKDKGRWVSAFGRAIASVFTEQGRS
ncbi:MAG: hypothetical protein IPJ88_02505 [Myxococcales bacterium]|nr:MAG: hypothetical protein IPJ88_02505 [Myxococcales bacterium]